MRNLVWTNASLWWWVSWSWAMRIALFYVRMRHEESRNEEISTRTCKTKKKSVWFRTLSPRRQQESSLKTRNEPISVSVMVIWRKLKLFKCSHSIRNAERPKTFQFPARMSTTLSSSNRRKKKTEIELKSLILAQIERWRHALHMQVERQHRELALWWRVANGWVIHRNVSICGGQPSERMANTAWDLRVKAGDRKAWRRWSGRWLIS